jgi:putative acetyltransferase
MIEIVEYRPELRADFERLNRIWLEGHSLLEPLDVEYLQEPERRILAIGGQVFFAVDGTNVVGTCAAIPFSLGVFELAKLSVDPAARGQGLGRRLCEAVLAHARHAGATEIVLTSNEVLVDAIRLYESLGFEHAPLPDEVRYETANVFMRRRLADVPLAEERVMPETFTATVDRRQGLAVISAVGYINAEGGEQLASLCYQLIDEDFRIILINMAKVQMVNSIGISILIEIVEKLIEIEGKLALCDVSPAITRTFQIMGFAQYAEIYPDEATAVAALT